MDNTVLSLKTLVSVVPEVPDAELVCLDEEAKEDPPPTPSRLPQVDTSTPRGGVQK